MSGRKKEICLYLLQVQIFLFFLVLIIPAMLREMVPVASTI
jgi:hypothetical protein